jgi:hypothetical protein
MDKQIEEMAKVIKAVKYEPFNDGKPTYTVGVQMQDFVFALIGEALYNAGYRKIPEGAVVINKDENPCLSCPVPEDIQRDVDCSTICGAVRLGIDWQNQCRVLVKENKQLTKALAEARKETAEKFAEMAKEGAFVSFMGEPIVRASKIDEICKEITGGRK